ENWLSISDICAKDTFRLGGEGPGGYVGPVGYAGGQLVRRGAGWLCAGARWVARGRRPVRGYPGGLAMRGGGWWSAERPVGYARRSVRYNEESGVPRPLLQAQAQEAQRLTDPHAYPRPFLEREEWISLNGDWEFSIDTEGRWCLPPQVDWNSH